MHVHTFSFKGKARFELFDVMPFFFFFYYYLIKEEHAYEDISG